MAKKTQTNKTQNIVDFSELCKGTYTRQTFKDVWIKPIFGDAFNDLGFPNGQDYLAFDEVSSSHASNLGIEQCILLGMADYSDERLFIFEIELKDNIQITRNRVGVQAFIRERFDRLRRDLEKKENTTIPAFGLLMAFYQKLSVLEDTDSDSKKAKNKKDTSDEWRLSLCIQNNGQYTTARRYTYVFGSNKPCHTPNKQFNELYQNRGKLTLKDVIKAFSVEAVTKEFYKGQDGVPKGDKTDKTTPQEWIEKYYAKCTDKFGYYQWYQVFQSYVILHSEDRDKFGAYFSMADKPADEKDKKQREIRDYVKKLFGRIVFLFFLQKKGWLGCDANDTEWKTGNQRFMQDLLDAYIKDPEKYRYMDTEENVDRSGFLDAMLEPLFFKNLNHERTNDLFERDGKVFKVDGMGKCKIPYLNGGLFSKDPVDPPISRFPEDFFIGFFGFLDKYNFTIYENDPMDVEVSVDPEMLGKIFEGLLEDNKDKGAFYTPKEIVHYMCKESLIAYLNKDNEYLEAALRHLVEYHDLCGEASSLDTPKIKKALRDKLIAVKICDPAIGSGAFPMGLLQQLLHCRLALGDETDLGEMKRSIIQNNIYGVDIDRGAIDIARLRFWLSLVVDAQKPEPLPNLNYKIMQGNSLLESYHQYDLSRLSEGIIQEGIIQEGCIQKGTQGVLSPNNACSLTNQLLAAKDDYFSATQHDTKALDEGIIRCCKALVEMANLEESDRAELSTLIPKENDKFFMWHLWFKDVFDQGGFDIVIGNPPYLKEADYKAIFDQVKEAPFGKQYKENKMNYWYFFFHKGRILLKSNGILTYIASNYFKSGNGAQKLNKTIVKKCSILQYVDFNKLKIFDGANVNCMILCVKNATPREFECSFDAYICKNEAKRDQLGRIISSLKHPNIQCEYINFYHINNQTNILTETSKLNFEINQYREILDNINKHRERDENGIPIVLSKLFKIRQGIVDNPSFLSNKNIMKAKQKSVDVKDFQPGEFVFVIPKNKEHTLGFNNTEKSFLREYHFPSDIHKYYCNANSDNYILYLTNNNIVNIDDYPNIKNHLIRYKPFMDLRRETEEGKNKWFHLHWPRKEMLFDSPKIVYPQMAEVPTFAYSPSPYYVNMSSTVIIPLIEIDLKVLTCILNSELAQFWFLHNAKKRGIKLDIGENVLNIFPVNMQILNDSILVANSHSLIDAINIDNKSSLVSKLISDIDDRIYKLYSLSNDDIATIKSYIMAESTQNTLEDDSAQTINKGA